MKNYLREQGKKRKKYKGHKNIQIFAPTRMGKGKKLTYKEKKKLGIRIRKWNKCYSILKWDLKWDLPKPNDNIFVLDCRKELDNILKILK